MPLIDRIYQAARAESRYWNLLKTLFHTSIFWLLFLGVFPQLIVWGEGQLGIPAFAPQPLLGWIFFALLGSLGISSGVTMSWLGRGTPLPTDCPNQLVIAGPYRWLRNPMAVAGIGQAICVGLILGSWMTILYALSGAVFWHLAIRPSEERDLYKRFGESYLRYKRVVWCWIPSFKSLPKDKP